MLVHDVLYVLRVVVANSHEDLIGLLALLPVDTESLIQFVVHSTDVGSATGLVTECLQSKCGVGSLQLFVCQLHSLLTFDKLFLQVSTVFVDLLDLGGELLIVSPVLNPTLSDLSQFLE